MLDAKYCDVKYKKETFDCLILVIIIHLFPTSNKANYRKGRDANVTLMSHVSVFTSSLSRLNTRWYVTHAINFVNTNDGCYKQDKQCQLLWQDRMQYFSQCKLQFTNYDTKNWAWIVEPQTEGFYWSICRGS